jgi:hypothetical protein
MHPTVSFILPVQNNIEFLMEQINAVFKFSERYQGFCELIIVSDLPENGVFNLIWLTIKLNKITHPHVRARIIRYASHVEAEELVKTGLKNALGEKIVIAANTPQIGNVADEWDGFTKRDITVARFLFEENVLKNLA